jgi:ketosteroid isomerase-like protein
LSASKERTRIDENLPLAAARRFVGGIADITEGETLMKTSGIVTLTAAIALTTTLCGCASLFGGGPSDKELVEATLAEWKAGLEAQDIDKLMAQYSEDFEGQRGGKPELRGFLEGAIDQGYVEGAEVDLDEAETAIEGDMAWVTGVYVETETGGATIDFELKKEADGVWRIITMEMTT